jgi:glyoxylase-like metal-dependent hydrolase (beta-lactamase superfamily II)
LATAGCFAAKALRNAELKSFEDLRRQLPVRPILVYITHPHYDHLRSFPQFLKSASPDVVIYYANRVAPQDAAELGKLVGETRPSHTSVVFEAKAAASSVLQHVQSSGQKQSAAAAGNQPRELR